jgi:hypothetical protein
MVPIAADPCSSHNHLDLLQHCSRRCSRRSRRPQQGGDNLWCSHVISPMDGIKSEATATATATATGKRKGAAGSSGSDEMPAPRMSDSQSQRAREERNLEDSSGDEAVADGEGAGALDPNQRQSADAKRRVRAKYRQMQEEADGECRQAVGRLRVPSCLRPPTVAVVGERYERRWPIATTAACSHLTAKD